KERKPSRSISRQLRILLTANTVTRFNWMFLEKETIRSACSKKRKVVCPKMQMVISMYGLYMILTIFRDHINRTAELCVQNSTDDMQYHAIWSNQCIELWYLLHFSYFHSDIHRQGYWPKLTEWLKNIGAGEYSKGRPDMYEILKPYMEIAIANAKRLDQMNAGKPPASSAPGTKVYELIELLKPYLLES